MDAAVTGRNAVAGWFRCKLGVQAGAIATVCLLLSSVDGRIWEKVGVRYLDRNWEFRKVGETQWYPGSVPGCVHTDLLASGLIEDPFYRDNELKLQWIGEADWEYRCSFWLDEPIPQSEQCELVFEGLDTYATVLLNGTKVLDANNMFREWRVPCKDLLRTGENILEVHFRSPIREAMPRLHQAPFKLPAANDPVGTSPYTRKAPYHYGWDWGPRFVTCGIWRPVYLERWHMARIASLHVIPRRVNSEEALLTVLVEAEAVFPCEMTLVLESQEKAFAKVQKQVHLQQGSNCVALDVTVARPRLWWPNGMGEQALYTFVARLLDQGKVLAERTFRTGIRSLELRQTADQWGKSFTFVVNGVPVFAKGANWIPADVFLNRVTPERYRHLLSSCRDAGMNMVRVWGGGVYEDDEFYRLCDELGLMVWQDFMFSCSLYPGDPEFLENVHEEAIYQVKRLRHHPSIVLWCGNNEMEWGWFSWGWQERFPASVWADYEAIFHKVLPAVCQELDPTRPYWPSSPSSNFQAEANSPSAGDMHYWGVWHAGAPFAEYEKQCPRFMSEYGFQSFPELKTVQAYTVPADHDIQSPVMMVHQKHPRGNQIIREYMLRDYPEPKDFPSFLYLSQVLQAEGIKRGAEHLRRIMPRCMGSLYWQIDDCWPVASWSSIDYFGRWKALHYYARRFYAELLVSPYVDGDDLKVYVVSDRREQTQVTLAVELMDVAGQVLMSEQRKIAVEPQSSKVVWQAPVAKLLQNGDPKRVFLHCALRQGKRTVSSNSCFFAAPKDFALPAAEIEVRCREGAGAFVVALRSHVLARHVWLSTERCEGFFSDNYFDLLPGRSMEVAFTPQQEVTLEEFEHQLRVVSLADCWKKE
ncbi:MAG: hypothetical protein ONB25_13925 [candidate division KSB1 bacterium]|nr:hypothetical protein [candidate division KSB1 bacterium]MDZ7413849.1 hypothetical protein [candidate division KSB1 bacterium]